MMKYLTTIVFLLLWFPNVSHAAIARDSSLGAQITGSATSLTYSFTNTAGNLLILSCQGALTNVASNITGATYNAVSMTKLGGYDGSGGSGYNRYNYIFYLISPATGANNVVVSSSPAGFIDCYTQSYSGVKTTGNPFQTDSGRYAGTNASITFSPTTGTGRWAIFSIMSRSSQDAGCFASASASVASADYVTNPAASMVGVFDSNGTTGSSYTFGFSGCTQSATNGFMYTFDPAASASSVSPILAAILQVRWW